MVLNWQADFRTWTADRVERAYIVRARSARILTTRGHRLIIWWFGR